MPVQSKNSIQALVSLYIGTREIRYTEISTTEGNEFDFKGVLHSNRSIINLGSMMRIRGISIERFVSGKF